MKKTVLLAVTGASGSVYAKRFIEKSSHLPINLTVIFTQTGKEVFEHETGIPFESFVNSIINDNSHIFFIDNNDFNFKYASGSNILDCMVILPCSMGQIGRISQGLSVDLIGRIADVQLKERRKLVIVPREMPYNLIHLKNMVSLTEAGAIIAPASPSFYTNPTSLEELVNSFTERIMELLGVTQLSEKYRW